MDIEVGARATQQFTVTDDDTAEAVGSGSLPVLATPRLLAWCEAVTCAVVDRTVPERRTSVGTRVQLEHLAASPVGASVEVSATVTYADGRLLRFDVVGVQPGDGGLVAQGEVTRVVVDRERFLSRLPPATAG
jgi:predicted thioesterase